jgi:mannitol-1-/sugar-/sorbitol-6-phosphatase
VDVLHARAIVFDKDGVLLDTMAMIRETWAGWARARGLDPDEVLASIHMTGYELLARFVPTADPGAEFRWIGARQAALEPSIVAFGGAAELISRLPRNAWAVVTSARREVSIRHLGIAGLPVPDVLIAAEDTPRGKPDPAGYRLAAERLGVRADDCVVVEDAPAGVRAARDAGMSVVAVTTTHMADDLREADAIIGSLTQLEVVAADGDLAVRIRPSA